jgi:hypothetical protein
VEQQRQEDNQEPIPMKLTYYVNGVSQMPLESQYALCTRQSIHSLPLLPLDPLACWSLFVEPPVVRAWTYRGWDELQASPGPQESETTVSHLPSLTSYLLSPTNPFRQAVSFRSLVSRRPCSVSKSRTKSPSTRGLDGNSCARPDQSTPIRSPH